MFSIKTLIQVTILRDKKFKLLCSQTWLIILLIIFVLVLTNISTFVTAQDPPINRCLENGNYTSNSPYRYNLNRIFASLPSDMSPQGFHSASFGEGPDRANVLALCRPDIQPDECRSCIQSAVVEPLNSCQNQRQVVSWRRLCMLRYSNDSIIGNMADSPAYLVFANDASDPQQFHEDRRALLDQLLGPAAMGGSMMKVAAGDRTSPDLQTTIYMLLQCSPDISPNDCRRCLTEAAQQIPGCCNNSTAMNVLLPSCILRYDARPFYNLTRIQEAQAIPVGPESAPPAPAPESNTPPTRPSPPGNGSDNTTRNVIIIVVVIVVSLTVVACVGIFMIKRRKREAHDNFEPNGEMSTAESLQYDFGKIRAATNDFSDSCKLGQGGFGAVYKGKLQNGQEIAVKRLSKGSSQGDLEFKNEVILVARLQHRNLVRLLGFALEGTERLLVYEFVENASLDHFIFDPVKRSHMDWDKRYKIIGGIARGLLYLHEDSRLRIIHRDLKAANILLDTEMNPKIADFGMARLFEMDQSEGITNRIVGTYGYMAPEYAMHGQFSVKSDVFSFGVLVLEIISGQKNNTFRNGDNLESMLNFAWKNWREGTTTNMIDPVLRTSSGSLQDLLRCVHIGLLCVQENVVDRPTMASVVLMLNSFSITLQVPSQPAFFVSNSSDDEASLFHNHNSKQFKFESFGKKYTSSSKNDDSITDLYPH